MKQQFYITGTQTRKITVEISRTDLAYAIMDVIQDKTSLFDDGGCDLYTTLNGFTYVGSDMKYCVSDDPNIGALADAMNVLRGST